MAISFRREQNKIAHELAHLASRLNECQVLLNSPHESVSNLVCNELTRSIKLSLSQKKYQRLSVAARKKMCMTARKKMCMTAWKNMRMTARKMTKSKII
jgi:hypothetical protein